jgi:hypothetical protein
VAAIDFLAKEVGCAFGFLFGLGGVVEFVEAGDEFAGELRKESPSADDEYIQ